MTLELWMGEQGDEWESVKEQQSEKAEKAVDGLFWHFFFCIWNFSM